MIDKQNECIFWLKMMTYLKIYTIWNKVSADINKEFDSKSVYDNMFWKLK